MAVLGPCSFMKEISKVEEAIQECDSRIGNLEKKLQSNQTDILENELVEVKKLLATYKKQLSGLHRHNQKNFYFAAALCFVIFAVYMLYILFGNKN